MTKIFGMPWAVTIVASFRHRASLGLAFQPDRIGCKLEGMQQYFPLGVLL